MQTDVYDVRHVSKAFAQVGYTLLEPTPNRDGWITLNEPEVKEMMDLDLCT